MTYKELVNAVLIRLREDTVNSVTETDYSRLVGAFINDAKRVVEDAWPWSHLLRQVNLSLVNGVTAQFDLADVTGEPGTVQLNERARIYVEPSTSTYMAYVKSDGDERALSVVPQTYLKLESLTYANDSTTGEIESLIVGTNPSAASGKSRIRLTTYPPIPDDNETILLYVINPQNELSLDADVLLVPSDPVVQLAYLYCLYERGEEVGEMLTLTSNKAEAALADAIMFDSMQTSDVVLRSE